MARLALLFLLSTFALLVSSKTFTRCELARTLKSNGFSRIDIADWVCLAEAESSLRTNALNTNKNGSKDYGIFQINNGYWCTPPSKGNDCKINCNQLLDDNISDDMNCARIIYRRHNFEAWYGWKAKCKGKDLSKYVAGCGV